MKRIAYLVMFGFVVLQTVSYAEMIQGTVTQIDTASNTLIVERTDWRTDTNQDVPRQVILHVAPDAELKNLASLLFLKIKDRVKVDYEANRAEGTFEAKSIELASGDSAG